jgi:hypothetical protein
MDNNYILSHLKKLSELLYKGNTFATVLPDGRYEFGRINNRNIVTKKIAIYLCIDKLPDNETEKKEKRTRTK